MRGGQRYYGALVFLAAAAAGFAQVPSIAAHGIVNGASYLDDSVTGGALPQGGLFVITGTNLGPGSDTTYLTGIQAGSPPYDTTLGGVSVRISQGSTAVAAYVVFAWTEQVNAILPSDAPVGDVRVTVTYNGRTSAPAPARVTRSSFGILSMAGGFGAGIIQNRYPDGLVLPNTRRDPAQPGQVVVLRGTGLGPIPIADNVAPGSIALDTPVEITVGGRTVTNLLFTGRSAESPGIDELIFQLPDDVPDGCFVPVQVRTGADVYSNVVTLAVDAAGTPCTDRLNPFARTVLTGGRVGSIELLRLNMRAVLKDGQAPTEVPAIDLGGAAFFRGAADDPGLNPLYARPPVGLCTAAPPMSVLTSLMMPGAFGMTLDAGPAISVNGPVGTFDLKPQAGFPGEYYSLLGGRNVLQEDSPTMLPFLTGGQYTLRGSGGRDVGAFRQQVTMEPALAWTNRDSIRDVERSLGVTLEWTGGDADSQVAVIFGGANTSTSAGGFLCVADLAAGSFTVPAAVLATVPPVSGEAAMAGFVMIGALPSGEPPVTFSASGIERGNILATTVQAKQVGFE